MEQGNLFYPPVAPHRPDICYGRHHGNQQSIAANKKSAPFHESDEQRIEKLIQQGGSKGLTSADLELILGKPKHKFSGRISRLLAEKKVCKLGTRDGCAVLIHKQYA